MDNNKNNRVYSAPSVKSVSFAIEKGLQISQVETIDLIKTTGYMRVFGDGGRRSGCSFWDMGDDSHFGSSTTGYDNSHEWSWD